MSLADWTVVPRRSMDPQWRLLCLPYAGGTAGTYRPWAEILPPEYEVHAVQLPGREWRIKDPPLRRVEPVVEALLEVVAPLQDRPLALFGHSLGALIAFELARAMRRGGMDEPAHMFVSAHRAPQLDPIEPALRADCEIADSYEFTPGPPLTCPVSAFGGVGDTVTPRERLEPWGELTQGPFKLRMLPGGHFFVNDSRDLVLRKVLGDLMAVRA